jgi:hypothetical protein
MGVYAVAMSIGFMAAFPAVGAVVLSSGWRAAWAGIGVAIVAVLAPLSWLLVRSTPESIGLQLEGAAGEEAAAAARGATLGDALRTPSFWVFGLASSIYGLVASGIALFNESILAERGFDPATYHRSLVVTALTVLASAIGPLVLAQCVAWTGSYAMAFYALASVVATLGVAAALVPLPEAAA